MRLSADNLPNPGAWHVWHAEWCKLLKRVVWVDDVLCQWAQDAAPFRVRPDGRMVLDILQAKKILIMVDRRLIIINPLDDADDDLLDEESNVEVAHGAY